MPRAATLDELRARAKSAGLPIGTILRAERLRETGVTLAQLRASARRKGELRIPRPVEVDGVVWRVVTCAPSEALSLADDLEQLGWRVCCPIGRRVVLQARLGGGKRGKKIEAYPVFSGYLFVGEKGERLSRQAHGRISGVVSDSRGPLAVPKAAIEAISTAECSGKWDHTNRPKFAKNAEVTIKAGAFTGFNAVVQAAEHSGRVRLSILMFGQMTVVRVDPSEIAA